MKIEAVNRVEVLENKFRLDCETLDPIQIRRIAESAMKKIADEN